MENASPSPPTLLDALRARGVPVVVLAGQCGVTPTTVYAWSSGARALPLEHAETIAALVGRDEARALYGARRVGVGRGRVVRPDSPGARRAVRAVRALLGKVGRSELADQVADALEPAEPA